MTLSKDGLGSVAVCDAIMLVEAFIKRSSSSCFISSLTFGIFLAAFDFDLGSYIASAALLSLLLPNMPFKLENPDDIELPNLANIDGRARYRDGRARYRDG